MYADSFNMNVCGQLRGNCVFLPHKDWNWRKLERDCNKTFWKAGSCKWQGWKKATNTWTAKMYFDFLWYIPKVSERLFQLELELEQCIRVTTGMIENINSPPNCNLNSSPKCTRNSPPRCTLSSLPGFTLREASHLQNGWIFGKVPNGLWPPPSFSESYVANYFRNSWPKYRL